jgi:hypothetical protein
MEISIGSDVLTWLVMGFCVGLGFWLAQWAVDVLRKLV